MKITEDVRRYAKENAIDESSAIQHGLRRKAEEFQHSGGKFILNMMNGSRVGLGDTDGQAREARGK
jgi:hypothetical protein